MPVNLFLLFFLFALINVFGSISNMNGFLFYFSYVYLVVRLSRRISIRLLQRESSGNCSPNSPVAARRPCTKGGRASRSHTRGARLLLFIFYRGWAPTIARLAPPLQLVTRAPEETEVLGRAKQASVTVANACKFRPDLVGWPKHEKTQSV